MLHPSVDTQLQLLGLDPAVPPGSEQWGRFLERLSEALQREDGRRQEGSRKDGHSVDVYDEFLSSISHEMRTPLSTIVGRVESLLEGLYDPLTDSQRHNLKIVEESARQLLGLVNDILDLSRLESGKIRLEPGDTDVEAAMRASLKQVLDQARRKQIRIISQRDPAVRLIRADERRLCQMLINLLINAVKYTHSGGTVWFEIEGNREQERVFFRVRDNGIGIAEGDLERLFQRYERLGATGAVEAGTGLGLVMVQLLASLHGGEVLVQSELGSGSCFTIVLPWTEEGGSDFPEMEVVTEVVPVAAAHRSSHTPLSRPSSAPLVLVVDDNEMNTTMLSDYLEVKGYRVALARNGYQAIEQTQRLRPAVVLMDLQMPEMDGLEAMRRIRQHAELVDVPIIGLTALAMPGDRERCLAAGANDYLSKPVSLRVLLEMINRQIQRAG
jgi:signal transduction histidine kinase/CheY-like chemotaxis protein